jgi:rare lipoprotein A
MKHFKKAILSLGCLFVMTLIFSFTGITKVAEKKWQGIASYYHSKFNGRRTSTGEVFSNKQLTAANNFLKLGTLVKVTNLLNGKSVIVKINDRMNQRNKRLIDLSQAAAAKLDMIRQGIGHVSIEIIGVQSDFLAGK